jgi:hypothetical protein
MARSESEGRIQPSSGHFWQTIDALAMASVRRQLRARLAAELRERRAIEARARERSAFLRAMYAYMPGRHDRR